LEFLNKLQSRCLQDGARVPTQPISQAGDVGTAVNIDPIHGGIQPFLGFLSKVFKDGLEYHSINVIRSAVSTTHAPLEGSPIGQHPSVSQLMKVIYNSRPPKPRYTCTRDVDIVVRYLKGLGSNTDLSLKTLSGKLILLKSLTLASRTSELHALDLRFRFYRPEGVLFRLTSLTKKRKVGSSPKECFFRAFPQDNNL